MYVSNYKTNFVWAYNVKDLEKYHSGLRELFGILKNSETSENLREYIKSNNRFAKIVNTKKGINNIIYVLFVFSNFKYLNMHLSKKF